MATPEPTDDAWRALQLQFDLVKHAETKAAATLASSGVLGGLLYSLVSQNKLGGVLFALLASLTAVAIVVAATAAGNALRPRMFRRHGSQNLLFYSTIADRFGHDADAFGREFSALLSDRGELLATITGQILSNANVAARKYHAVNVAIFTLLAALALMAATAAVGLTGW
ncbi:hypothetical protein ACTI_84930 [Actinoplanes sp. OR16]|uniref:Pycsar system effector family protein n=1 Tax=Actinoplanes sp. OR16 TaxID=946334 RepID=UPI000F714F92|nr:Pycsar system effector family protein [Actinoplanes sp. OR16]BBH71808.1 hypothetical protein ACTI_84930 [Actinoplanes sp. OR16]